MSRFSCTWRRLLTVVLVLLAAAALGFAPGYLTGLSGSDVVVLAAILPAIVTVGAGALLAYRSKVSPALISGVILMFSACLVIGVNLGESVLISSEERLYLGQMEFDTKNLNIRRSYLQVCSEEQWKVNISRSALLQPPLRIEDICPNVRDSGPGGEAQIIDAGAGPSE